MDKGQYLIRTAIESDIDSIVNVDLSSHAQWNRDGFVHEMGLPFSHTLVAEVNGEVTGFIVIWYIAPEVQIQNIAVMPEHRRSGLATALVHAALRSVHAHGELKVFLEVREKNTAARSFYSKLGFQEINVRKNYYTDDNAVVLEAGFNENQ